jgi:hypothetical protein
MKIETKFDVYDMVIIIAIQAKARVLCIRFDGFKISYEVEIWINSEFKCYTLYEDDLNYE